MTYYSGGQLLKEMVQAAQAQAQAAGEEREERAAKLARYLRGFHNEDFKDQWQARLIPNGALGSVCQPTAPAKPERGPIPATDAPDEEYRALCREIGFAPPQILQYELEEYLAANFIGVYDPEAVVAYMHALCHLESYKQGRPVGWVWKPLRDGDTKLAIDHIERSTGTYKHPIPKPVLETVRTIIKHLGDRVAFVVTDYEATNPDPFLAVTAPGLPLYVIERWDEPGFRG